VVWGLDVSERVPHGIEFRFSLCERCLGELFCDFLVQPTARRIEDGESVPGIWQNNRFITGTSLPVHVRKRPATTPQREP
jgi:hypothetical protein